MPTLVRLAVLATLGTLFASPASAGILVRVTAHGSVEYTGFTSGPLGPVAPDESVTMSFLLDTDQFLNSPNFPTRGYRILPGSFVLEFDSATTTLQTPYPAGQTPWFVIRDNDPAVDGFLVSSSIDFPTGVPLAVPGIFGQIRQDWYVTYGGSLLPSLDLLDALGTYDFTGLTVFNWTLDDGPANPMGMIFESLSIEVEGGAWTEQGVGVAGVDGTPRLLGSGSLASGSTNTVLLVDAAPSALTGLFVATTSTPVPFKGGLLYAFPIYSLFFLATGPTGQIALTFPTPAGVPAGVTLWLQYAVQDVAAPFGASLSNALAGTVP